VGRRTPDSVVEQKLKIYQEMLTRICPLISSPYFENFKFSFSQCDLARIKHLEDQYEAVLEYWQSR